MSGESVAVGEPRLAAGAVPVSAGDAARDAGRHAGRLRGHADAETGPAPGAHRRAARVHHETYQKPTETLQ